MVLPCGYCANIAVGYCGYCAKNYCTFLEERVLIVMGLWLLWFG